MPLALPAWSFCFYHLGTDYPPSLPTPTPGWGSLIRSNSISWGWAPRSKTYLALSFQQDKHVGSTSCALFREAAGLGQGSCCQSLSRQTV